MADTATTTAAPRGGLMGWAIWIVLSVAAAGGGAALPWLLSARHADHGTSPKEEVADHRAVIPFGDLVVNLGEERLTRYLRVKVLLVVEDKQSKEINELMQKQKAFLKSWLIGYLSDQSLQEVGRAAGVNRIRREILNQFNAMLFPDGSERIIEVLFDEFVVQ
jgi:flagellar basal body-associated protein FliL